MHDLVQSAAKGLLPVGSGLVLNDDFFEITVVKDFSYTMQRIDGSCVEKYSPYVDFFAGKPSSLKHRIAEARLWYLRWGIVLLMAIGVASGVSSIYNFSFTYTEYGRFGPDELWCSLVAAVLQMVIAAAFLVYSCVNRESVKDPSQLQSMRGVAQWCRTLLSCIGIATTVCDVRILARLEDGGAFGNWQTLFRTSPHSFIASLYSSLVLSGVLMIGSAVVSGLFGLVEGQRLLAITQFIAPTTVVACLRLTFDFFLEYILNDESAALALYAVATAAFVCTVVVFNMVTRLLATEQIGYTMRNLRQKALTAFFLVLFPLLAIMSPVVAGVGIKYVHSSLGHAALFIFIAFSWFMLLSLPLVTMSCGCRMICNHEFCCACGRSFADCCPVRCVKFFAPDRDHDMYDVDLDQVY